MAKWAKADDRGGSPQPGLYKLCLVRRGPFVPGRITQDEYGWHAEIDGETFAPVATPEDCSRIVRIWTSGVRVDSLEYELMQETKRWASLHQPQHPCLRPYDEVRPELLPPVAAP